ncbi:hypothetical protein [Adhaeribacter pallidiroseus]|uniref:Uncharacterized protein n=1 Tax=Adhaeribacter pallidiroseus TaxID=2072847 RepID=A0A369Q6Q4_9BACT|nr:hypothetical protein [Adhaeribacter pallidiroseus]RDC58806.1 hypothetical protein AHMF7616_05240 [Adhaeribacter pallidiroseus]
MTGLIDYIVESIEVDQLTLGEVDEALFYIDLHLDQDGDISEVIHLFHLKSKLLDHLTQLEKRKTS